MADDAEKTAPATDPLVQVATRIPRSIKLRAKMRALRDGKTLADLIVQGLEHVLAVTK